MTRIVRTGLRGAADDRRCDDFAASRRDVVVADDEVIEVRRDGR